MRSPALIATLSLLLPVSAAAKDQDQQNVEFQVSTKLFRGQDKSFNLLDSDVTVAFTADVDVDLDARLSGGSMLTWPDGALTHGWVEIGRAGLSTLTAKVDLEAEVIADISPFPRFTVDLWTGSFTWSDDVVIKGLLLEGGEVSSVRMTIAPELRNAFSRDVDVSEWVDGTYLWITMVDSFLRVDGDLLPDFTATLSGEKIVTDGRGIAALTETTGQTAPNPNEGVLPLTTTWRGNVTDARFDLQLLPTITLCDREYGYDDCHEDYGFSYTFDYLWKIATHSGPVASAPVDIEHVIPALDLSDAGIDLGEVIVGEQATYELSVAALSSATVRGDASVTGDAAFDVVDGTVSATATSHDTVTVTFSPSELGEFTGTLVLEVNDPADDRVTIPLTGTGVDTPPDPEPDDTGGNGWGDDTGVREMGDGCNCSSAASGPGSLVGLLAVLGAFAVRRRR